MRTTYVAVARWTGQAWQHVSSEPVWKLAVAYGDPQNLWSSAPNGIIHSADGGATWQPGGGYAGYANDIAIDPSGSGYLVSVFVVKGWWGSLARSTGNGQWTALPFPDGNTTTTNIQGMAVDGATGDIYLAFGSRHFAGSPFGGQIWRTANPDALRVDDVRWELGHDFGPDAEIMLLASGWSPQPDGLALYANVRPALQCDPVSGLCDPPSPWVLHRSQDGGQSWQSLPIP